MREWGLLLLLLSLCAEDIQFVSYATVCVIECVWIIETRYADWWCEHKCFGIVVKQSAEWKIEYFSHHQQWGDEFTFGSPSPYNTYITFIWLHYMWLSVTFCYNTLLLDCLLYYQSVLVIYQHRFTTRRIRHTEHLSAAACDWFWIWIYLDGCSVKSVFYWKMRIIMILIESILRCRNICALTKSSTTTMTTTATKTNNNNNTEQLIHHLHQRKSSHIPYNS